LNVWVEILELQAFILGPALILPQGRLLGSAQTLSNTDGTDFTDVRQKHWDAFAKKQGE
jgi:hypothetical protein